MSAINMWLAGQHTNSNFFRNALNDQFDLIRHQLAEKMVNDKTHSALIKLTYNCLKERDCVLGDRDFLNLQQ